MLLAIEDPATRPAPGLDDGGALSTSTADIAGAGEHSWLQYKLDDYPL